MGEIATRTGSTIQRANWQELAAKTATNPLLLVPAEVRPAIIRLWMCNAHLLESSLALSATFRLYMDEWNLPAADVERICERLLDPARRANHTGSWVLMAELSALVADTLKSNKARDECEERRKAGEVFQVCNLNAADLFLKLPEM